jgi:RIO kinase 1
VGRYGVARIIQHDYIFIPACRHAFILYSSLFGRLPLKTPKRLLPLIQEGLIDEVLSQLMSGKEATVYIVRSGDHIRCAKVYKDTKQRSFKNAATYLDGRQVKNSRQARAMQKGSRYGRQVQEEHWQNAEVDALFRLANAGVCVPEPYICSDGVLLMELILDENGEVAPRLNDVEFDEQQAIACHGTLLSEVVRMLLAGMIHGDLSEYNVLLAAKGPVIIDLPQAVDAARNSEARSMLIRDVDNMAGYFGQFAPSLLTTRYGQEIWALFEKGELHADSVLTGKISEDNRPVDLQGLMLDIEDSRREQEEFAARQLLK